MLPVHLVIVLVLSGAASEQPPTCPNSGCKATTSLSMLQTLQTKREVQFAEDTTEKVSLQRRLQTQNKEETKQKLEGSDGREEGRDVMRKAKAEAKVASWLALLGFRSVPSVSMRYSDSMCPFPAPTLPAWSDGKGAKFNAFMSSLAAAKLDVVLLAGTLLGAYRHGGTVPDDLDMDMAFNICLLPEMTEEQCKDFEDSRYRVDPSQGNMGQVRNQRIWDEFLKHRLEPQGIRFVQPTQYGIRLSNGDASWTGGNGVGVDFVLIAGPGVAGGHEGTERNFCQCQYGPVTTYCPEEAEAMLEAEYGSDYMTPN